VKVASLLPDVGTEIDDGDGDSDTKSFLVKIADAGVVTVRATPDPNVPEQCLPGYPYTWGWKLEGGIGTSRLTRTVDRTTPAKTVLICTCGSSSKTTRIYVVKVDVDIGLSEIDEINPGKYINVNWDNDDGDGWSPNDTPPDGVYTGDKDDPNIKGGDNDFRSFTVSIYPSEIPADFPASKIRITFPGNVKVWQTNTKLDINGASSAISSGSEFAIGESRPPPFLEGVSGSGTFRDVNLMATYMPCDANDTVKLTVFEVTLTGLFGFGPQQEDDDKKHSKMPSKGSSDKNGKISWDDANADGTKGDLDPNCVYFHNCMEDQGTIKPSGVTTEVEFDFYREIWCREWKKKEGGDWLFVRGYTLAWNGDEYQGGEDLTPSVNNHIYQTDGPGWATRDRSSTWDYLAQIADFRDRVRVKIDGAWYWCSDFYKWHTKCYTEPKDENYMTRAAMELQQLGSGWITVPDAP
jgi:hypothetical protein